MEQPFLGHPINFLLPNFPSICNINYITLTEVWHIHTIQKFILIYVHLQSKLWVFLFLIIGQQPFNYEYPRQPNALSLKSILSNYQKFNYPQIDVQLCMGRSYNMGLHHSYTIITAISTYDLVSSSIFFVESTHL